MTRVVSLLLAVVMVLSMAVLPASAAGFRDVTTGAWYAEAVDYVTARGYMAGTGEDTFAPNAAVTRAMFVTVLAKMAGAEIDNDVHPFEDVPAGTWYSGAVAWAAEQGIVSGTGAGKFSPNKNITRQDMSLILANFVMATGYKLPQEGLKSFTDADKISAYAREAVEYGTSAGLMSGYSDGTFRPAATATRAQLAVIVMALDKKVQALDAEPVPMPAQSFEKTASGIAVGVKAPVGAVPAGTELQLGRVTDTDYLDVIGTRTGADVIGAVDISFMKDGAELEPERAVEVEISMAGLEAVENPTVVHVKDDGTLEYVSGVEMTSTRGARSLKFKAKDFSIYAVVENEHDLEFARATVNFYRSTDANAEPVKSYFVQNKDTLTQLEKFLADPGIGDILGKDQIFNGWTIDKADANEDADYDTENYGPGYSTTTKPYTIAGIRTYLAGRNNFTEGEEINIYPIVYNVYVVTYKEKESGLTMASDNAFMLPTQTLAEYTISQDYTVLSQDANFEGWYELEIEGEEGGYNIITTGDNAPTYNDEPATSPYAKGTKVVIKGDVTLSNDVSEGHWLVFEENGYGATYNAPIFLKQGEVTRRPRPDAEMTRPGYSFEGWYTGAPASEGEAPTGQLFTFGNEITERTVLYAKWSKADEATYTVVIWKQNIDGDGYDFVEAIPMKGTTGSEGVSPVTKEDDNTARVTGNKVVEGGTTQAFDQTYSFTGFHLEDFDSAVQLKPAGGTVINVHFDRNEYTLEFQIEGYVYTPTTSNNGTQYGLVNGEYVQLTRHGRGTNNNPYYWTYNDGWISEGPTYTGTRYTRSNGWVTIKEITALFEQSIKDNFPIVGTDGTSYATSRWDPQNSSLFNRVMVYLDIMPNENIIFHQDTANFTTKTIHYYVEALPNETPDRTYNGKGFVEYKSLGCNYNFFTEAEDYVDLVGFKKGGDNNAYPPQAYNNNGTAVNDIWENTNAINVYCYYTRLSYVITFSDGTYVDGKGNTLDMSGAGVYTSTDPIVYGADISSYNKGGADYYVPTAQTGFVLEGWYLDKTCTVPYTFDDMPLNGIQVFAKWRQIEYRVFLHPNALKNGVRDESLDWGTNSQQMNFRIAYNGTVSIPSGLREGYQFIGWYTDEAMTHPFDKGTRLTDSTVPSTPAYDKTKDMTDNIATQTNAQGETENVPMDKWGLLTDEGINKDVNRFWIERKLDLYCKWSKVLDALEGITVTYDANVKEDGTGGTGAAPTDKLHYKESANAVAQTAVTPADPDNYQFAYWVMQRWDASANNGAGAYVDVEPEIIIYPGQNFSVLEEYAQKTPDLDENGVQREDGNGKKMWLFNVQLRAEFAPLELPAPTHVIWYANGGTKSGDPVDPDNLEDQYVYSPTTPVNTPIEIQPDLFKHPDGKIFIGWYKMTEAEVVNFTTDDEGNQVIASFKDNIPTIDENSVWLRYHPADAAGANEGSGHTKCYFTVQNDDDDINGEEVEYIAADEYQPYEVMVAVWSNEAYYYIYHSATNTMEAHRADGNKVNLKDMVTPGYLYGGYYKHYGAMDSDTEFDATYNAAYATDAKFQPSGVRPYDGTYLVDGKRMWKSEDAYTANGTELIPQGSAVYCIKEVPESYLTSRIAWTYDKNDKNKVIDVFLLSVFDDKNYNSYGFRTLSGVSTQEAVYVPTGTGLSRADATTENHLAKTFQLVQRGADGGEPTVTIINSNDNFGVASGFISVSHMKALADKTAFSMLPFWVTPDGIEVTNDPVGFTKIANYNANGTTIEGFSWNRVYDGAEKIYVKISGKHGMGGNDDWDGAGAVQILYFYNQNIPEQSANGSYRYACAVASRTSTATIFAADVPVGEWTHVIIIRCQPGTTAENFSWDKKWTQTTDIAIKNSTTSNSRTDISTNYIKLFNAQGTYEDRYEWGIFPTDYNAS